MTQLTIQQAFDLAVRHQNSGRYREAEALYRQILAQQPNHAGAMRNLGIVALEAGRTDVSLDLIGRAIVLAPNDAVAHCKLGMVLAAKGKIDEAIAAWRQAIALKPDYAESYNNLGVGLKKIGQGDEAIAGWRQAIALRPNYAEAHNNLANALEDRGQFDDAIAACRQAIAIRPDYAEAHSNLGNALFKKGELERAIAAYRQAVALDRENAQIHWNLAAALLSSGRFEEGWEEYEWRLRLRSMKLSRNFPQPYWNGGNLAGQTLLIYTEGGFGDALNSIRLVPMIRGLAGKVVVECQPELMRLFANIPGVDVWIARGDALPPFDCRISLLSLPRILGIRLQSVPNSVPYLSAPRQEVEQWTGRIPQDGIRNVGLCWAGSRGGLRERTREIGVFVPLAKIPGVRFFSLQKGPEAHQSPPDEMNLIDHTHELSDFADTAALIENLDLVISVDTSIAHLAGALAKPVWVLFPNHPDFRWMAVREDSPWYPTMRLFRQPSYGDWGSVIARMVDALTDWVKNRG